MSSDQDRQRAREAAQRVLSGNPAVVESTEYVRDGVRWRREVREDNSVTETRIREVERMSSEQDRQPERIICCPAHVAGPPQPNGMAACCDPNDCGPCCEQCPTCPTLRGERAREGLTPLASALHDHVYGSGAELRGERFWNAVAAAVVANVETVIRAAGGEVLHYNGTMPPDGFGSAQLVVPLHPADEPRTVIVLPPREVSRG